MARTKASAKRPHEIALEVLKPGVVITPTELEKHVGNGPYASKHIWYLRKLGHDITVNKDGRTVVSYVYNGPGHSSSTQSKAKAAPAPVSKAEERRTKAASGQDSNYSVDPDWDAVDTKNVRELL